jgi:hypothetical protein
VAAAVAGSSTAVTVAALDGFVVTPDVLEVAFVGSSDIVPAIVTDELPRVVASVGVTAGRSALQAPTTSITPTATARDPDDPMGF